MVLESRYGAELCGLVHVCFATRLHTSSMEQDTFLSSTKGIQNYVYQLTSVYQLTYVYQLPYVYPSITMCTNLHRLLSALLDPSRVRFSFIP